ncbi:16S rRNA (guanine(527)-N(7))-methyltransferase RsmG [Corynebacterium heidelbergense]|uniref:Ribosomal RNA small subunit methyltransferase G n=1 Tax=Corynebacterium heidelbergense TaxID=2055947 RepID=A0A364VD03_9CORY|nr:16S rRNA (guanine(527)-N(7))-methyltransferase RsmG [Corynebacterium heidelbergense]RAV34542.1 16S rRNA (guanine(527)-N(7))-methyltransferase RsmG [Corynebacterium heidelbergense]WCZ37614.1 Ribosomal RNA small subunit methyltransferase G [Corynebacterium heidelbergense]
MTSEPEELGAVPEIAATVLGERLPLAARYAELLATAGVERGLIGPRETPRLWDRHILNSAVLGEAIEQGARVVDVGSGAGLPGIPLAIARPDLEVQLVEPLLRRCTFLGEVLEELSLPAVVVRGRAEEGHVRKECGGADVVTSRAVAPLHKLMRWSLPLCRVGGAVKALKGASAAEEVERDAAGVRKLGGGSLRVETIGRAVLSEPTYVVTVERRR